MSRRRFLAIVAGVAAATGLPEQEVALALTQGEGAARRAAELTTLAQALKAGAALNPLGYRPVVTAAGEPHLVRELGASAQAGRERRRRALLSFIHLTDQHVIDVESPGRVEFLDRYSDGPCAPVPFQSAFRPQEAASARIADAMIRRLRRIAVSPVTGAPLAAAVCTGDNTDNQQGNELDVFLTLMNGGLCTPGSGDPGRYEGVQVSGDVHYWHPASGVQDLYKTRHGFPALPTFLADALAPFDTPGLGLPWYTCYGNHDGLAQGNAPVNPAFAAATVGPLKVVGLPPGTNPCTPLAGLGAPGAPAVAVTADPARAYLRRREWIDRHLKSPGLPRGHGFTDASLAQARAYYAADVGPLRFVVLDTVNPGGHNDGSVGDGQLRWLEEQLKLAQAERRLVLLFSHHGPRSLTNPVDAPDPADPAGGDLPRRRRDEVVAVVDRYSCVIAWVNGHSHENVVRAAATWWDIGTAAHIDWPAQCRLLDVVDNADGTLSIFATMVDHEDDDVATVARELAGNDPQAGFATGTGRAEDRNVELVLAHPFPGDDAAPRGGAGGSTLARSLPATGLPPNLTVGGALAAAAALGLGALRARAGGPA